MEGVAEFASLMATSVSWTKPSIVRWIVAVSALMPGEVKAVMCNLAHYAEEECAD